MKCKTKAEYRQRRHNRLRRKVTGTAERPRMSVFISNLHLYVQFIDDQAERTLASVSTVTAEGRKTSARNDVERAKQVGKLAAQAARSKGIEEVVFDRGGYMYTGRIKALADAAREEGLKF